MFWSNMSPKVDSPWSVFVILSCFLMNGLTFGLSSAFGIFYVALLQDFPGQESQTAWVVSLDYSMAMLVSPLTIYLCRRLTPRAVCCAGVLLTATSFYFASKATNLVTLYFTFGLMFGVATSLSNLPTIVVVRTNFEKHLGKAMAIGIGGTGAGGIVFSLLLPSLIVNRGWRGTLHYLSYITLSFSVCGLVLFPSEQKSRPAEVTPEKPVPRLKEKKSGLRKMSQIIIPSSWHNKAFLVLNTALVIVYFVISIVYCHIVNFAVKQGLSLFEGSKMSLFITVGSTAGRLSIGPITSIPGINRILLGQVIFLGFCVTVMICPLVTSAAWLMFLAGVLGFLDGNVSAVVPLLVDDVFSDKNQAMLSLGHLFALYSIPYALGAPVAGWLYSIAGSYDIVFFSCGALLFVASCMMSLVYFLLRSSHRRVTIVDGSEDVVSLSATGGSPTRNADTNDNRLFNLRMCSLLDLSAEIPEATNESRDSHAYGNLLLVPRVHPGKFSLQPAQLSCEQDSKEMSWPMLGSFPADQACYTDINCQISGLTQRRRNTDFFLNATEKGLPDSGGIELSVFTELDVARHTPKDGLAARGSSRENAERDWLAQDCCDVSKDDAGYFSANTTGNSMDNDIQ